MSRLFIYGICFLVASSACAEAKVFIDYHFDRIITWVSPVSRIERSSDTGGFALNGQDIEFYSGSSKYFTKGRNNLRLEGINAAGVHYTQSFKMLRGSIVVRLQFPGFYRVDTIRTDGVSACTVTVSYHPLPGQRYIFSSTNTDQRASEEHAENVGCQIHN